MSDTEKIKIAEVIGNASTGGVISCVMNFYRAIDKNKFDVHFYTYGKSPFDDEIKALGGKIFYMPNVMNLFKSVSFLKKNFKAENYDIVHAHMTTLSFIPLFAAKLAGVKHRVCHAHSTTHSAERVGVVKNALKHFSRIFATDLAGCSLLSIGWLYGKKRAKDAFLLRNAIDLDRFAYSADNAAAVKERLKLEDCKIIGNIGRFAVQKNQKFLIQAFAMLTLEMPQARLLLIGDGKLKEDMEEAIKSYGVTDKAFILPEVRDVEKYYSAFDLFALPSLYEGLPLVAIEAQAAGTPCLLSDQITKETDVSGNCVFLPVESTGIWAEKMKEMMSQTSRFNAAAALEEDGYDIYSEAKRLEKFYLELGGKA